MGLRPPSSAGSGVPAGGTIGQVLAKNSGTDGDATWQTAPAVVPVFNVKDKAYGAFGNNSADDSAAFQAAHAAAAAAGGILYAPPGNYKAATPVTGTNFVIQAAENLPGFLAIRGAGRATTTFTLTNPANTLLGNAIVSSPTAVIQRYSLEDFTINAGAAGSSPQGIVAHLASNATDANVLNVDQFDVRRVNTRNGGSATGQARAFVKFSVNRNGVTGLAPATYSNVTIEDCKSGISGGGGSYGIELVGYVNASSGAKNAAGVWAPAVAATLTNPAQLTLVNININRFTHDTGKTPVAPIGAGSGDSVGVQLGGDGVVESAVISNTRVYNCSDCGFEIDSGQNVTLINCEAVDCHNTGFLTIPYGAGAGMERSHVRHIGCRVRWQSVGTDGSTITTWQPTNGFVAMSRFGATGGHVTYTGCEAIMEAAGWTAAYVHFNVNGVRSVLWDRCLSITRNWTISPGGSRTLTHFSVLGVGHRATAVIRDCAIDSSGTISGAGSVYISKGVNVGAATDLHLTVSGLSRRMAVTATAGGSIQERNSSLSFGAASIQETFGGDQLVYECGFDSGAASNYTWAASAYTASANLTTENRGIFYANLSTGGDSLVGRTLDGAMYWKATPGPTLTGYKAGAFQKRSPVDATTYLESYVYDDGTNSYLCLDKITAGTRTSLLGTVGTNATGANGIAGASMNIAAIATPPAGVSDRGVIVTRIANATAFWPRLFVQGNTVIGEYWTTAPTAAANRPSGTGANVQVTLVGGDITTFGANAPLGYVGFSNVPQDAAAKLDDLTWQRLHVINATIERVALGAMDSTMATSIGFEAAPVPSGLVRGSQIRVRNCDFATLGPASSVQDFNVTDTAIAQMMRVENHGWWAKPAPPAAAAATGSPFTYTNTNVYAVDLFVYGGTLTTPFVEVMRDGVTWRQVAGATGEKVIRLQPGESARLTYSAAPSYVPYPVL